MSKYVPPHRRKALRLQEPADATNDFPSPITPSAYSASRWHGDRPTSSGGSSSAGGSGRPASVLSAASPVGPNHQHQHPHPHHHHFHHNNNNKLLQAHGDSFVGPLMQLDRVVDVHRYSGATAKGLGNAKSQQQVGRRIVEHLDRTRPDKVLLQFGNVDINISSVYQLEKAAAAAAPAPAALAQWSARAFVADVLASYEAFLHTHIFPRLERPPPSGGAAAAAALLPPNKSAADDPPAYIRHLYLCEATLPVVADDVLPESHAKYQFPKKGRDFASQPDWSAAEEAELERQAAERICRVRPLVPWCGIAERRAMTAHFNERLREVAAAANRERGPLGGLAEVHIVNLNQYIHTESDASQVAAPYVTADPVSEPAPVHPPAQRLAY